MPRITNRARVEAAMTALPGWDDTGATGHSSVDGVCGHCDGAGCEACDTRRLTPPWATGDMPDPSLYVESELVVAGAISTLPPFSAYHPAWALPHARIAIESLSKWESTDG